MRSPSHDHKPRHKHRHTKAPDAQEAMNNQPRNVALLGLNFPPEQTGISPYTGALASGLADAGYRVGVVTAHPHYPDWKIREGYGRWQSREIAGGVHVRRVRHYIPRRPSRLRRALSEITFGLRVATTRWGSPDVVVAVSPALFATAIAAARWKIVRSDAPFIVWVQDLYTLGLAETAQGKGLAHCALRAIEGWVLRHASHVVVIHERFADRVHHDFNVPRDHISVVRNWTHHKPLDDVDVVATRHRYGWQDDEIIVLHAGNIGIKQYLENVIEAARLADKLRAPVRFILLGNGSEAERLRLSARGIDRVEFFDSLPEDAFDAALRAADVLLVNEKPGVAEMAVPSKLTTYFSTGRPVLAATDPAGITASEIVASGAGVVVPPGDPRALLQGTLDLVADPSHASELGAKGPQYRDAVLSEQAALHSFSTLLEAATLRAAGHAKPNALAHHV